MLETVLVVPRSIFDQIGSFQGFNPDYIKYACLFDGVDTWLLRSLAENNPDAKQLIPYVLIKRDNQYLSYARTSSGGEARLHGFRSIGVGGHINPEDKTPELDLVAPLFTTQYLAGVSRELIEEISISGLPEILGLETLGLINDDTTDVGRVHLGVVHLLEVRSDAVVHPVDSGLHDLRFVSIEELLATKQDYETWSQIVIEHLGCRSNHVNQSRDITTNLDSAEETQAGQSDPGGACEKERSSVQSNLSSNRGCRCRKANP